MKLKHKINGKKKEMKWKGRIKNWEIKWSGVEWNGVELSDIEYSRLDF